MKKSIDFLLLSSNSRKLYQENVFNAISLPKNYIIQYRYNLRYLEEDLYKAIYNEGHIYQSTLNTYFKNKNCVLAYLHKEYNNSRVTMFRCGTIKQVIYNADIDRLLLFIELKEFTKLEVNEDLNIFRDYLVKSFNSTRRTCIFDLNAHQEIFNKLNSAKFFEVAETFSSLIPARLFFSLSLKEKYHDISSGKYNRIINPVIDPSTNLSKYELEDGSNYYFEILTYEVNQISSKHHIKERVTYNIVSSSEFIDFNQHILDSGSFNLNYLDLIIKPIPSETVNTSIRFTESQTKFITNILIDIKKSKVRSLLFAFSTFIVLITVPLSNLFINIGIKEENEFNLIFGSSIIIFVLLVILSLRFLYRYFDKK